MDIAGHVSKQMLKHYSHIRMEAKRSALETVVQKRTASITEENGSQEHEETPVITQVFEGEYPLKSPQSSVFGGHRGIYRRRKSLKIIDSSGRTQPTTLRLTAFSFVPISSKTRIRAHQFVGRPASTKGSCGTGDDRKSIRTPRGTPGT